MAGPAAWLLGGALLLAALYALAPHEVSDADALSRLATGRYLVEHGLALPASDPFTFSAPEAPFGDPEWLGDLILYGVFRAAGPAGLQAFVLLLAALGYALALGLGARFGARPGALVLLLGCTLPAVAPRVAARNDAHLLWIVPAFAWLCSLAAARRRLWIGVTLLGWLWAQLNASFLLGLPLLAAGLLDADRAARLSRSEEPGRDPGERDGVAPGWLGWILIAIYPALPWLGVSGRSSYRQLIDHISGAPVYRSLISEWQSPLGSPGLLAILPLHLLAALGAYAVWRERKSASWLRIGLIVGGCGLAYASRRFLLLMPVMIAPPVAAAVSDSSLSTRAQRGLQLGAAGALLVYLSLALRASWRLPSPGVWGRLDSAERAANFIAEHAPAGARVANTFNDGPWLVWLCAPRIRHYLDPRNNLGAALLARYVDGLLPDPSRFRAEADRLEIGLALMRARDPRAAPLAAQLAEASDWPLVYWDGHHALHARADRPGQRQLIALFGYRILKARFDLAYLDRVAAAREAELERELTQLEQQSSALATALRAYRLLRTGDAALAARAARGFESAIPDLPESRELLRYWRHAVQIAGTAR